MVDSSNQMFNSEILVQKAQVAPGMHVADFGCGRTGHMVFSLSPVVGERGVVYAVDVLKDILLIIKRRAEANTLNNIQTVWSNLEKIGKTAIPTGSIDAGFLINVLFQSNQRHDILTEAARLLKDKARLVIVDWARDHSAFSPPAERLIDFNDVKNWGEKNGFVLQEEFSAGPFHRGLVLFRQV